MLPVRTGDSNMILRDIEWMDKYFEIQIHIFKNNTHISLVEPDSMYGGKLNINYDILLIL